MIGVTRRRVLTTTSTPPPPLPYDAQVEYISADGTQYIDTGIHPSENVRWVMDVQYTDITSCFSGAYNGSRFQMGIYSNKFNFGIFTQNISGASRNTSRHTIELNAPLKLGKLDNTEYSIPWTTTNAFTGYTLYLMARKGSGGTADNFCKGIRIYGVQIYDNGNLVFDGIPVRKNGEGYLYDNVSGNLFGNAGTGTITYGNDVE